MKLQGKNILITGGGTGIGAASAAALARAGARVAICGRRLEPLQAVADAYHEDKAQLTPDAAGEILCHAADVGDRPSVKALFEWAAETLGEVHILMNAAGINVPKRSIAETSPEDWDRVLRINTTGTFNCIQAVLPQMRARKDGLIINIGSIAGMRAIALGGIAYDASKFAQRALGISVGDELCEEGIRVTNIHPGEVDTPILENRPKPITAEHRARILRPEDVAETVVMVAGLPARAHVWELVIKPASQRFV